MPSSFPNKRIIRGPKLMRSDPPGATILMQFNKPVQLANVTLQRCSIPVDVGRIVTHPGGDPTKLLVTPTLPMAAGEDYRIYERVGFKILDTQNKERIDYGVPYPFRWTITP